LGAAVVPFETAALGLELLDLLPELARKGNANAASDVGVAGLLASAAAKGAVFNVEINLDSLPGDMGQDLREQLPDIKERIRKRSRDVMDAVRERMNQ
jgi:formiminotetrahydrofolate cyclodeaminase